ncbi:MAG: hypothetical protein M1818_001949 [Claussenomyces sp. TS43310]|nr:MAG: hypothetical protein M1818_001949 [Claussenomyces sp. TS43310]
MKSAFGSKRKARKIQVDEDDEDLVTTTPRAKDHKVPHSTDNLHNSGRKPLKKSSLRQSIAFDDDQVDQPIDLERNQTTQRTADGDDVGKSNSVVLPGPTLARTISISKKKKSASSRLSFGPGEIISGDAAEALEDDGVFTPKKSSLGRRAIESNAARKSLPAYQMPHRGDDEERPTYNKDYLNELKTSTPSTPKDLRDIPIPVDEDEGLDEAELEGATIVEADAVPASIPSEAEIREKKERRARSAREKDFISLNDGDSDDNRRQISLLPSRKKTETRLVREDEDLGEGFDEFVEDGRISLGKKAERQAKRRYRKEMADLIHEAEGSSSDTDDSEAERRAAYEAAQTRAGMDGLAKPDSDSPLAQVPPRITPLANLSECLQRLQRTLSGMERELTKRTKKMVELQQEKAEISAREEEVQRLLKEAGDRYTAMRTETGLPLLDSKPLTSGQNGSADPMLTSRGLESFGNTPVGPQQVEDIG